MHALEIMCTWLAAGGLFFLTADGDRLRRSVRLLAVIGLLTCYMVILTYLFDVPSLTGVPRWSGMPLSMALGFLALFTGICQFGPQPTWIDAVMGVGQGGRMARRLVLLVVLGPLIFAAVAMRSRESGAVDPDLILVCLTAILTFAAAETVNRTAQAENLARQVLRKRNLLLEQIADSLPVPVLAFDAHGEAVYANGAARWLTKGHGSPAAWLLGTEFARRYQGEELRSEERPGERILRGEVLDFEEYAALTANGWRRVRIAAQGRAFPYEAPFVVAVIDEGPAGRRAPSP